MLGVITANAQDIVAPEPIDTTKAKITPQAIEARIAQMRMGDIVVTTKPGAEVEIEQLRHKFLFGTAVANQVVATDENAMSPFIVPRGLDRLAKFNLLIKITEGFFCSEGEESMAQEMQTILPIYFAHPSGSGLS